MSDTPALSVRGLDVVLGDKQVLHALQLDLAAGRWTGIVGPNGAGKSTLLKALAGLLPAGAVRGGSVLLAGEPLHALPARARARRLAWLGQSQGGAEDLRVLDVALLGRLPHQSWLAAAGPADRAAAERALRTTQAWDWRDRPLGQLSGGERQRVLLARALAVEAEVLLMDEPLSNLDPPHQADWIDIVRGLVAQGRTVVSVLHEVSVALQADALVLMAGGCIVHQGASGDAATQAALVQVFDGRIGIHAVAGRWVATPWR